MRPLTRWIEWIGSSVFPTNTRSSIVSTCFRGGALMFLVLWSIPYFRISVHDLGEDPGWMHHVHLVFHEAGHAIAGMIVNNRDIVVFMGSGMQVLFPLIVAGAFYWTNSDSYSAALGLWWAGHATLDVAPYIADARALDLELLSGGTGKEVEGHDWEYLLTRWNALPLDTTIAERVALAGRILMVAAFLWAAASLIYNRFVLTDKMDAS